MTGDELDELMATGHVASVHDVDYEADADLIEMPVYLLVPSPGRLLDDPDIAAECLDVVNDRMLYSAGMGEGSGAGS